MSMYKECPYCMGGTIVGCIACDESGLISQSETESYEAYNNREGDDEEEA